MLLAAIVMEIAVVPDRDRRGEQGPRAGSWARFVRNARAPELPVILLEDFAALTGLVLALIGVVLTLVTGNGVFDGLGSMAIGVLLVVVAIFLAIEMKSLLLGESATREAQQKIVAAIENTPGVQRLIHIKTLHLGPEEVLVAAKLGVERRPPTRPSSPRSSTRPNARSAQIEPMASTSTSSPTSTTRTTSPTSAPPSRKRPRTNPNLPGRPTRSGVPHPG